jgi:hypothetical protein
MQQCLTIELVNYAWYEKCADKFLAAEKESLRNNKCVCNVYGNAMADRSTTGHWVRRVTAFKSEKQKSTMISLAQAILSQLSVLKCCSMLMTMFVRIDASQPKNWH